jgi:hypothetical protein
MRRLLSGLLGGAAGTAAMTLAMQALHRRLPPGDRYPLPPRQVAMAMADKSGLGRPREEDDRTRLTLALHFGYGISMGAVYAMMAPRGAWAPLAFGLPFGLAVWTASYLGWLPAVGLHRPATHESTPRNGLMIASHFVWAGTLAGVVEALNRGGSPHTNASWRCASGSGRPGRRSPI